MRKKETWYIGLVKPPRLGELRGSYRWVRFQEVEGYQVTVPGYEEFDFFVHGQTGDWNLTDGRSGCFIVEGWPTIKEVKEAAKARLDRELRSVDRYRDAVEKSVVKNGLSPRYREEVKL